MKLTGLKAHSVRGIPRNWPLLAIDQKGLIIYGPNGVGKSSIIDALEFALTQSSSLFPRNRLNVSWDEASPHVRHGEPEIEVVAKDNGRDVTVVPEGIPANASPAGRAWLETAREANFVLRRHMLLRFINEQPRDRYALLEPFMNFGTFQDIEAGLKGWADELKGQETLKCADAQISEQKLRQIFEIEPLEDLNHASMLAQLSTTLDQLGLQPCRDTDSLPELRQEIAAYIGGKEKADRLGKLGGLKTQIQRLGLPANYRPAITGLIEAFKNLEAEIVGRKGEILTDLLTRGREIIEAGVLESCPLCEQTIDHTAVLARLSSRIAADARITAARQLVNNNRNELSKPIAALAVGMAQLVQDWTQTIGTQLPDIYHETAHMLGEISTLLEKAVLSSAHFSDYPARFDACVSSHTEILSILDALITGEGGGERRRLLGNAMGMIDALLADVPKNEALWAEIAKIKSERTTVDRIYGHAVAARKEAVQTTLTTVSDTANRFYEAINPGEEISRSKLQVRTGGQGSVNLSTKFFGREEHPLLHLSESHLDTLGLSYFLALRKHEALRNPQFKVLILDDVLHSVDAAHRGRIAHLLRQEFGNHQIIIATHDEYFYNALRRSLGNAGYRYVRINDWDIDRGPVVSDSTGDLDVILSEELRRTRDHNDLSAACGRLFEWLLNPTVS